MSRTCNCGTPESDLPEVTNPYEQASAPGVEIIGTSCSICGESYEDGTFLHCSVCWYDVCEECQ